jgi:chaperonin GroES
MASNTGLPKLDAGRSPGAYDPTGHAQARGHTGLESAKSEGGEAVGESGAQASYSTYGLGATDFCPPKYREKETKNYYVSTTLKAHGNKVLIELTPPPEKTASGLFFAPAWETANTSSQGRVLAVGRGRYTRYGVLVAPDVKVGDTVIFTWINGREVVLGGRKLKVLDAREILAVIT